MAEHMCGDPFLHQGWASLTCAGYVLTDDVGDAISAQLSASRVRKQNVIGAAGPFAKPTPEGNSRFLTQRCRSFLASFAAAPDVSTDGRGAHNNIFTA